MKKRFLSWLAIPVLFFAVAACSDDEKNARIEVRLTDAPGDYQEVNIEITGIEIHSDANAGEKGWKSLNVESGVYNLLELTNGIDTLIGSLELPAGMVSQIRLKLGENNSLKVNDQTYALKIPSGQQSGLKLQVHEQLKEGITYKILLDFDVARSILLTGSNDYKLKPVIRAITEAQDGAIEGVVDPAVSTPAVYAILAGDTITTAYTDETGHFMLRGLGAGTYQVTFEPNSEYVSTVKYGIAVTVGNVTDLGTITVDHQ